MSSTLFVVATVRESIADFLRALLTVYIILIFAYILTTLFFSFGGRIPYAQWSSAVLGFLRDVTEPYLSLFRRFIPPIGPLDISPIIAVLLITIVGLGIIVPAIHG